MLTWLAVNRRSSQWRTFTRSIVTPLPLPPARAASGWQTCARAPSLTTPARTLRRYFFLPLISALTSARHLCLSICIRSLGSQGPMFVTLSLIVMDPAGGVAKHAVVLHRVASFHVRPEVQQGRALHTSARLHEPEAVGRQHGEWPRCYLPHPRAPQRKGESTCSCF